MSQSEPTLFATKAQECAKESISRLYDDTPEDCALIFTEPKPVHDSIRNEVYERAYPGSDSESALQFQGDDSFQVSSPTNLLSSQTQGEGQQSEQGEQSSLGFAAATQPTTTGQEGSISTRLFSP